MIWSYLLAAIGIYGIYLSGKKNKYGFMVGLFAQVLWVTYAVVTAQYGFVVTAFAYGIIYTKSYLLWNKEEKVE